MPLTPAQKLKKLQQKAAREKLEQHLLRDILALKLPRPVPQYKFHPDRDWRFDWAWPEDKFSVEINGGEWINGAHNRGNRMALDCEKIGEAMLLGWDVYVCTGQMVVKGVAIGFIKRYFIAKILKKK